jgi:hypothetical protein
MYLQYIKHFLLSCICITGTTTILQAQQNFAEILRTSDNNFYTIKQRAEAYFARVGKVRTGWKDYKRWEAMVRPNIAADGKLPDFVTGNRLALETVRSSSFRTNQNFNEATTSAWQPLGQANPSIIPGNDQSGTGALRCMQFSGNDVWVGTPGGGIWYGDFVSGSTYNWTPKTDGLPNLAIEDIEFSRLNNNIMYALTGAVGGTSGYRSTGVIKSTDGGNTWSLTGLNFPEDENIKGYKLLIDPTDYNTVWAATDSGLYRTTDGGTTWNNVKYYTNTDPSLIDFSLRCYDIQYKPGSITTLYATSSQSHFYKSTDGGITFLQADSTSDLPDNGGRIQIGLTEANTNCVYLLYANPQTNGYLGLYRSLNSGSSFNLQSGTGYGILGSQSWRNIAIAVSPTNINDVYVGGLDVFKSTNGGVNWTGISDSNTPNSDEFSHADIFRLICTPTYLYCASDGGLYRMTRSNDNWVTLNNYDMQTAQVYRMGIDPTANADFVSTGLQDNGTYRNSGAVHLSIGGGDGMETIVKPSNTNVIYLSSQYGYFSRTDDGGVSNTNIFNTGDAGTLCNCNEQAAWTAPAVLRPGNDNHIYIGYKNIYYNTTSGDGTWSYINTSFNDPIISLEFARSNNTVLYATDMTSVYRYNLSSGVWAQRNIRSNLPTRITNFTELAVDPNDANHVIITVGGYTASDKVFETFNANAASPTWVDITRNLPNVPINCITIDNNAANTIYIGTDIGVFVTNDVLVNWMPYTNGLPTTRVYDLEINNALSTDRIYAATFGRGIFFTDTYTGCATNLSLSGNVDGLKYSEASLQINSVQLIDGGVGTKIHYNAGNAVVLSPGFHAKAGSVHHSYVQGCTDVNNSPLPLRRNAEKIKEL